MELALGLLIGSIVGFVLCYLVVRTAPPPGQAAVEEPTVGYPGNDLADAVRSSLAAVRLGILAFDSHGEEIYRNPAAEMSAMSRPARAVVNGEIGDLVAATLVDGSSGSLERQVELYGPPKTVLALRVLPTSSDESVGAVLIIDDVTSERRLQEIRRSFVANVSHELRTPVGAIAVLAETLAATQDRATIERLSDRLCDAAHRLGAMIEELLELTRIEGGVLPGTEPVPVGLFVDDAIDNLAESAAAAGVEVVSRVEPLDATVLGDRRQLRSAVQNLLDNALKYSGRGSQVRIDAHVEADSVVVTVADEGIGIPEADLDRVFERFYRVDAARRHDTGGSGLGLSIVRHVVANHGGRVSVTAVEGEGSTFRIELPVALNAAGSAGEPSVA